MRKILLGISILATTSAMAQTQVVQGVTVGKDYGVVYTLPKTEIGIEIKATRVTYTPGEFSRYADRYLRLSNISGEPSEHWELDEVKATSIGIPDDSQTYFIKLKDKTVAPFVELTPDGLIKSINTAYVGDSDAKSSTDIKPAKRRVNPKDFLTEEILMANSSAKMAELVSKEIYNIRESRNALLRGQADNMPKDGEQLRLMLESLEEQEAAMVEMFSGVTTREERIFNIRLTPTREMNDEIIFRFSEKLGVLGKDNLAGEPVYIKLEDLKAVAIPPDDGKKKQLSGVAYNVPGKARVTIMAGDKKMFEDDLSITQLGVVEYLAESLFNKNSTFKVIFNPATGGIVKMDRE